ncbi:hypothetical protein J5N97_006296 [Dioscorea zingiberensis]|uniref:Uncharacterized protein n=1 Tax=Dioscorea zingiberensis TaxID=325984 RepID=A0A9D5DBY7_9LILI|nr:hypothetical protein J5N97_006296 [Dioscorea zingiberensis]
MVKFSGVVLIALVSMLVMLSSLGSARPTSLMYYYGGKLPKGAPIPPSGPSDRESPETPPSSVAHQHYGGKLPKGPVPPSGPSKSFPPDPPVPSNNFILADAVP